MSGFTFYLVHYCNFNNTVHAVPGMVGNLVCTRSFLPSELSFSWEPPTLLGSEVVNYQVLVSRLEHRPGTRDVVQSSVYEKFVETKAASITGLGRDVIMKSVRVSLSLFLQLPRYLTMSQ